MAATGSGDRVPAHPGDQRAASSKQAATETNICVESTTRDAMMLDFRVVVLGDATAALSDAVHQATLAGPWQRLPSPLRRRGAGAERPRALTRGLDAGELLGQGDQRRRVVGRDEALFVQDLRAGVVHLEEELARPERLAGVLPGQLEQAEALRRTGVGADEV